MTKSELTPARKKRLLEIGGYKRVSEKMPPFAGWGGGTSDRVLVTMGLIERHTWKDGMFEIHCVRLTDAGRAEVERLTVGSEGGAT